MSIRKMLSEQADAWNRGDGAAWARDFTEDADFVNVRGDVFHGHAEIAQRHSAILGWRFAAAQNTSIAPAPPVAH